MQKMLNLLNTQERICCVPDLRWGAKNLHLYRCSMCMHNCKCLCVLMSLYKWQWNYLKPISAFHCNIFLSAGWLTQLHVSQLDTTSLLKHTHAKDCAPHPHSIPIPQKMNEVDISLKVKLKIAIITLLPVHYSNNAMWLFVLDWASPGVWPHNLILLAQTSLQPSATLALYSGHSRAQPFPTEI